MWARERVTVRERVSVRLYVGWGGVWGGGGGGERLDVRGQVSVWLHVNA